VAGELSGLRVAFLTANEGVEQVELTTPWQAVKRPVRLGVPEGGPARLRTRRAGAAPRVVRPPGAPPRKASGIPAGP
jgi:hypothetical protein